MEDLKSWIISTVKRLMKFSLEHRRIVLVVDLVIGFLGLSFSVYIFNNSTDLVHLSSLQFLLVQIMYFVFNLFAFNILKTYSNLTRHTTIKEMWRVFVSTLLSCLLLFASLNIFGFSKVCTEFIVTYTLLITLFITLIVRFIVVYFFDISMSLANKKREKTFVYEFGPHSLALAGWIKKSEYLNMNVQGFITRQKDARKTRIMDKPVYYMATDNIDTILEKHNISTILFPDYMSVSKEKVFISGLVDKGLKILVTPPLEGVNDKVEKEFQVKNIQLEDLLGRDEIVINMDKIKSQTFGKTILITGAAGSIGSEIVRQLSKYKPGLLILFDNAETPMHDLRIELENQIEKVDFVPVIGDIRYEHRLKEIFETYHPSIVFHAAAYKHVPLMEENPCESIRVNVKGTKILCDIAIQSDVECFVMISTDKAVNPTNVMGASKRMAEIYVQSVARKIQNEGSKMKILTTRFGNVLGSNGSVIPHFKRQIESGGPVTVTHPEIERYFMTIPEACRLVLEASVLGNNGEIYVFDMGKPVKIKDLAQRMIILSGRKPETDIKIVYTGLRPGEKLYEELLNDKEKTLPTTHEKITVAKVRQYDYDYVLKETLKIIKYADIVDIENTIISLKRVIGEYNSNNSPFEKFDISHAVQS
jgi:FlaA1/EpsC-like NDP-sugar epimerase